MTARRALADCAYPWRLLWRDDRQQWSLSNGIGIWFFYDLSSAKAAWDECMNKWPDGGRKQIGNNDAGD